MKKLAFISSAIFSSLTLLSVLFKFFHFPGGNILLIAGIVGLALIAIPSVAKYKYDKEK